MAAAAVSKGGAILFTATTDTYTDPNLGPIMIKALHLSSGSAAGTTTLKEGVGSGVADASGAVVLQAYAAIGEQVCLHFHPPLIADKGLKLSALGTGATVIAYLA